MQRLLFATLVTAAALSISGCHGSSEDVSQDLANAERYRQTGDLPKALVELRKALKSQPNDPRINFALARVEDADGDLQSAIPHYLRAAVPDANIPEAQLRIAEVLLDSERFAEVTGRLNTTLGANPGNPGALALRADLAERQGQVGPARVDADAALKKDPANARATAVLAMLSLRNKNGPAAIEIADRGLEQHPQDLRLLEVKAAALLTINQPEQAVAALRSIVRASPHNVAIQTALARVEAERGHLDSAIASFRAAVDADPANKDMQAAFVTFLESEDKDSDIVAFLHKLIGQFSTVGIYDRLLAEHLRSKGQLDQAGEVLDQAAARLKQGSEFFGIEIARAKLDTMQGRVGSALEKIDDVLAADPQNEEALLFRATLRQENGRPAAAVDDLTAVVRTNPVDAPAFQLLASAYMSLHQPKLAVDAMRRAVAVVPDSLSAQLRLAAFMQQAGQLDFTRDLMTRLTLQNPSDRTVWTSNAELALDRKDWPAAARAIAHLRDLPNAATLTLLLEGRSKAAQGDNVEAAKDYQDAIASDPNVDAAAFGAYARASVAVGQARQAADFLSQLNLAHFTQTTRQQLWAVVMALRADAQQFPEAGKAFEAAARLAPHDVPLYTSYMRILAGEKKLSEARQVATDAISAGASRADMLLLMGSIDELKGDSAAALKDYSDALAENPLSMQAANNYANLLADQDPRNIAALSKARDILSGAETTGNADILDTVAWLDYRLGRFDEAKRFLDQANAASSNNPQTRFHLAAVLLASGDRTQGLALLNTVKDLNFQGAEEARSLAAT